METFDAPRGTRDFLPDRMAVRNHVEHLVAHTFRSFGFQQVQTPIFEQYELLAARSGEEIKESMFTFASDAGRYALRPELTSPVCRIVASGQLDSIPKPYKLFYSGPCFRYCRPQEGRYREFFQMGIELLGSPDSLADAETIAVADSVLRNLGIGDYRLKVGNVGIFRRLIDEEAPENSLQREEWEARVLHDLDRLMGIAAKCRLLSAHPELSESDKNFLARETNFVASLQAETEYEGEWKTGKVDAVSTDVNWKELLEKLPPMAQETITFAWIQQGLLTDAHARLISHVAQTRGTLAEVKESATKLLAGTSGEKPLQDLWKVCDLLEKQGVTDFEVVLGTVRNLDFYTGTVFEIDSAHLGSHRQLCGGGRYDTLVEDFGGPKTPATGLAFSFDRLVSVFEKCQENQRFDTSSADVFVVAEQGECRGPVLKLAAKLRDAKLRATIDLMNRSASDQVTHARDALGASFTAAVLPDGKCRLTHLATGNEKTVALDDVAQEITRIGLGN